MNGADNCTRASERGRLNEKRKHWDDWQFVLLENSKYNGPYWKHGLESPWKQNKHASPSSLPLPYFTWTPLISCYPSFPIPLHLHSLQPPLAASTPPSHPHDLNTFTSTCNSKPFTFPPSHLVAFTSGTNPPTRYQSSLPSDYYFSPLWHETRRIRGTKGFICTVNEGVLLEAVGSFGQHATPFCFGGILKCLQWRHIIMVPFTRKSIITFPGL